jgi:hypothetical protein
MSIFRDERIWRILTNLWTVVLIVFLVLDFMTKGKYDSLEPAFSIIYTGVLGLYAGTKEFDRWYEMHDSRHPGELFVVAWTVLLCAFFAASFFIDNTYKVSPEIVADYIMVLSIFAITQKSKRLHHRKKKG